MKPRILVTQQVPQAAVDMLRAIGEVELNPRPECIMSRQELIEAVGRNDYLYCLLTDGVDAQVIAANPNLKIIANMAVGYDNVDIEAATARGIPVTNTPGVLTETTADLAWSLLLSVARRIVEADAYTRAGRFRAWGPMLMLGTDVYGKTLGIIGLGRIGQAVARRASGFDMNVLYYDAQRADERIERECRATFVALDELLSRSDFVTIHVPYLPTTHHLIGARELALMKPTAYLVNTARGPIVDEKALVAALANRQIAGAGLDVYEHEPQLEPGLVELPNTVLLPHIGSASLETRTKMAKMAASNVIAVIEGRRPPNLVNPQVYDSVQ